VIGNAAPLKILVVDDEPAIRRFVRTSLTAQGYQVSEAEDGTSTLGHLRRSTVDILVLDLGLPDINGLEIIERLRNQGSPLPIIVLSSRTDETGKVTALDLGADDYVTKPFDTEELLARVRASLRQRLASEAERQVVEAGPIVIDLVARIVRCGGNEVHVTPKEWDLLAELAKHPGRVLTHEMLLRSVWGPAQVGQTEYLRVAIRSLRQKLEPEPSQPRLIVNEPGVGYRLISNEP